MKAMRRSAVSVTENEMRGMGEGERTRRVPKWQTRVKNQHTAHAGSAFSDDQLFL